jgi:hypothetical protein
MRLGDGSLGTGISWQEILKREFEFSNTANFTTPPPRRMRVTLRNGDASTPIGFGSTLVQLGNVRAYPREAKRMGRRLTRPLQRRCCCDSRVVENQQSRWLTAIILSNSFAAFPLNLLGILLIFMALAPIEEFGTRLAFLDWREELSRQ